MFRFQDKLPSAFLELPHPPFRPPLFFSASAEERFLLMSFIDSFFPGVLFPFHAPPNDTPLLEGLPFPKKRVL